MQRPLVIVKPDGLKKSLTGNILTRLSEAKPRIIGAKVVRVLALVYEGENAIGKVKRLAGR